MVGNNMAHDALHLPAMSYQDDVLWGLQWSPGIVVSVGGEGPFWRIEYDRWIGYSPWGQARDNCWCWDNALVTHYFDKEKERGGVGQEREREKWEGGG